MTKYLPWVLAGVVVVIVAALFLADQADSRADRAEGRVAVLDSIRQAADNKARQDSLVLVRVTQESEAREAQIALERIQARQVASRARQEASVASVALRAVLDSLGASTDPLDSLLSAHAAQVASLERERDLADSTTATVRTLLAATERTLESERAVNRAATAEREALRAQIGALKSARRWDTIKHVLEGAAAGFVAGGVVFH